MALDPHSFRIGVGVTIVARLFDDGTNADTAKRPTLGPAAREPGEPTLVEQGTKGTDTYRRVWTVADAAKGAAPDTVAEGKGSGLGGPSKPRTTFPGDDSPVAIAIPPLAPDPLAPRLVGDASSDQQVVIANILPRKVRIKFNAHRIADEAEIELPLDAFPFPPDGSVIRSILVEIRTSLVSADDWAAAMLGQLAADGQPLTMPAISDGDEPAFVGFADRHRMKIETGALAIVTFPLRDLAGVAADEPCLGRHIETDYPVDEAIARFLSLFPALVGLRVVWVGSALPPTLFAFQAKTKTKASAATKKKKKPRHVRVHADKTKALEAIADYCTLAAVVPTFRGYSLYLAPARTLDVADAGDVPALVFGHNVESIDLDHALTQGKASPVEVRTTNPDTGRMLVGRWPDDPSRFGDKGPGETSGAPSRGPLNIPPGASSIDEAHPRVMIVHGINDPAQLREIARNVFEEESRQQLGGHIETKDIATDAGAAAGVADLLELRAGTPLGLRIEPGIEETTGSYVQRLSRLPRADAIRTLEGGGWGTAIAERLVDGVIAAARPLIYRVRNVDWTWTLDAATSWSIEVCNYIEALISPEKGGHRAALAARGGGSLVERWKAIDDDMLDGEISRAEANKQKDALRAEARASRKAADDAANGVAI